MNKIPDTGSIEEPKPKPAPKAKKPAKGKSSGLDQRLAASIGSQVQRRIENDCWIVPLGASGHPGSPHFADQAQMWADVEYAPQLWDWDEIAREAETQQELTPA